MPHLQNLLNTYGPSGYVTLAVSYWPEEREQAISFSERMPYKFTYFQGAKELRGKVDKALGMEMYESALLDPQGRVVYIGFMDNKDDELMMARVLKLLLAHDAASHRTSPGATGLAK